MSQIKTKKVAKGPQKSDGYHHGDLKSTLLDAAIKMLKTKKKRNTKIAIITYQ
jgi:methionine salvage enolase-phosphatase E1